MKITPDITPNHLQIIQSILQENLPPATKVWVFGSRATGKAKKTSDLDLLIDVGKVLSLKTLADLADYFDESDLPYKVDIVDSHIISDAFREQIENNKILLWKNSK